MSTSSRWFRLPLSLSLASGLLIFSLLTLLNILPVLIKPVVSASTNSIVTVTTTIQAAIDVAQPGDDILIPAGIYTESLTINKSVNLMGTGNSTTVVHAVTNQRVMTIASTTVISGLTIMGGNSIQSGGGDGGFGGGLFLDEDHSVTLVNSVVRNNTADFFGGGFFLNVNSSAVLTNTIIQSNVSSIAGGGLYLKEDNQVILNKVTIQSNTATWGGGLFVDEESSATLSDVTMKDNIALLNPNFDLKSIPFLPVEIATITGDGGGIFLNNNNSAELYNTTIQSNTAPLGRGGGLYLEDSDLTLESSRIQHNEAERGGGLYVRGHTSESTMTNNVIAFNKAITGGALYIDGGGSGASHHIVNNTIVSNTTASRLPINFGGIYCNGPNVTVLVNLILWNNGTDVGGEGCPGFVEFSMIGNGPTNGQNNIPILSAPRFKNAAIGDFHLLTDSLAIDHGTTSFAPDIDFDGESRPQGETIDIGADEANVPGGELARSYLPLILKNYPPFVPTPTPTPPPNCSLPEFEPNQDNEYRGALACEIKVNTLYNTMFANDADDWYYIRLTSTESVRIEVTNYPYPDVKGQLLLYEADADDLAKKDPFLGWWSEPGNELYIPDEGLITLSPGKYFIRVWSDGECSGCSFNTTTPYNLQVNAAP